MQCSLFRVLGVLVAAYVAVAGWRLWRTTMPGQRGLVFNRPPPKPRQQDREQNSPAPAVAPILRNSRSLDRTLVELDGMVGLASVKAEIRKLIDVLAAEHERARLCHRAEPQALHRELCRNLGDAVIRRRSVLAC